MASTLIPQDPPHRPRRQRRAGLWHQNLNCSFQFRFLALGSCVNDLSLWASVSPSL